MGHQGHKTGGRQKGSRNKRRIGARRPPPKWSAGRGGDPGRFAGDAYAFLVPRTVTRNGVRLGDRYT